MWFCLRASQTCLIKWCVKWRFQRNLVICVFLWNKRIFCQKNYPVVFVIPYPTYHKNMGEIEFLTLAAKLRICLIFTGRHSLALLSFTNGPMYKNTNKTKMLRNTIRANRKMDVILNFYFPQFTLPITTKCHVKGFPGTLFTNWTRNLAVKILFLSVNPQFGIAMLIVF